ncbi:uncharacterized protein N7473_008908 [Penicillium subrubescens]|uniref:uncharacterized protein n=1 Tax=Penicillium subrubescens TaxID=1316194 RepID=UPI002544FCAC|nr:uncharacterized protein N7473_008908 [Penicillium subrubescens]KAJ5886234.1 hypothetical protein N7473_008908 [Penicillium subrubescens]
MLAVARDGELAASGRVYIPSSLLFSPHTAGCLAHCVGLLPLAFCLSSYEAFPIPLFFSDSVVPMALPAICSPRSARLLLTGTVETPTYASIMAKARPAVKDPPIYFPGLKPLARPWRLHPQYRAHVDDLKKKPLPVEAKQSSLPVPRLGGRQNSLAVPLPPPLFPS